MLISLKKAGRWKYPKKVAGILEKTEEGVPVVLGLEERVKQHQAESETGLQTSEEEIERCKQVATGRDWLELGAGRNQERERGREGGSSEGFGV